MSPACLQEMFRKAETAEQFAEVCRLEAELNNGPFYCRDCSGLVSGDGMTIDPDHCCFFCRAD